MRLLRDKRYNVFYSDNKNKADNSLERSLLEATQSALIGIL